jgi:hypothetical protein
MGLMMADPRRLREILGFGYGAPSPAMSALEPFHAGVDPAYMPQDVVTESPGEGPSPYVRSGLESLLGLFAPSDRAAAETAGKLNAVADFNPFQGAYDIGKGIGDAVQGGDKLSLAMSLIPGKAAEKGAKVAQTVAQTVADDLVPAVKAAQKGIRAYHGTPHDFDKFSLDKIGTGEGAQAYGHGLYFAESEGVAKSYRDALSDNTTLKPKPEFADDPELVRIGKQLSGMMLPADDINGAIKELGERIAVHYAAGRTQDAQRMGEFKELLERNADKYTGGGHMYEVNINADPDAFLDWDKPLSEQGEGINTLVGARLEKFLDQAGPQIQRPYDRFISGEMTGEEAYRLMNPQSGVDKVDWERGLPEQASESLRQAGIPGIKYLDAGSRRPDSVTAIIQNYGSPEKALEVAETRLKNASMGDIGYWQKIVDDLRKPESRNYVVFSDEIIDIVKKYGIAGALGAGLITQQMADQLEAQQGGGQS